MTSAPSPALVSVNADAVLEVDFGEQRRWTVLLRIILAIPQIVVFGLVGIAAFVVVVIGWFAALVTGRLPRWAAEFLSGYVSWQARLYGYLQLLTDVYPPFSFTSADYPVRVVLGPAGELKRLAVLFRFILLIPAMIVSTLVSYGWYLFSFITWLIVLFTGRMPVALFLATSAVLRYSLRFQSYASMLTSAYPKDLFGDAPAVSRPDISTPATQPLILTKAARVLVIVFIVLGVLGYALQFANGRNAQHPPRYDTTNGQSY